MTSVDEILEWLQEHWDQLEALFEKVFDVYDTFMAFLDKLKDGGYELIQWIWMNIKNFVSNMFNDFLNVLKSPIDALSNFFHQAYSGIIDAVNQHLFMPLQHVFGPLWILPALVIIGLTVYAIVWVVDQVWNLL